MSTAYNIFIFRKSFKGIKYKTHTISNLLRAVPSTFHSISHIIVLSKIIKIINNDVLKRRLLKKFNKFSYSLESIKTCNVIYLNSVALSYIFYFITRTELVTRIRNSSTYTLNYIGFLWIQSFNSKLLSTSPAGSFAKT